MDIKCKDIMNFIEDTAPVKLAEEWDNIGLMLGNKNQDIKRLMVCLDVTDKVADEAIKEKVDLIISHHPFIFKGLKKVVSDDIKGKIIYKLIRNDIGVYSAHTNLDVADNGVNEQLANVIGLYDIKNLNQYKSESLYKVVVFVPKDKIDVVRDAMSSSGAGWIGNYSDCSFMASGVGTFKPLEGSRPYLGSQDKLEKVEEYRLETIVPEKLLKSTIEVMKKAHPYEEAAYDIYKLELQGKEYGLGKVGFLKEIMDYDKFISHIKRTLKVDKLKVIGNSPSKIKKVAVFCGSFDEDYSGIYTSGADILVTGDIKYHAAIDMVERGLCVIDAGHFSTERVIIPSLVKLIKARFNSLEVIASSVENDPIKIS